MVTKIFVCLEVGSESTGAFVPSCPGSWVFGRTPESAMTKVKNAIADWFEWLEKHGELVPVENKDFEVEASEMFRVTYNPVKAGKPEPLFWSEKPHITRKDIIRTLRLMQYSREDLLKTSTGLGSDLLKWKPINEPRTMENCLRHIAYVEPWYITRLNVGLPCRYPRKTFEMLNATRNAVVNYLQEFAREKMKGIYQPTEDASPNCNLWDRKKSTPPTRRQRKTAHKIHPEDSHNQVFLIHQQSIQKAVISHITEFVCVPQVIRVISDNNEHGEPRRASSDFDC